MLRTLELATLGHSSESFGFAGMAEPFQTSGGTAEEIARLTASGTVGSACRLLSAVCRLPSAVCCLLFAIR